MAKEVNREEFQRQKHYIDKKKQYAIDKLKTCFPKSLDKYNENIQQEVKDCKCQKDPDPKKGIIHNEDCTHSDFIDHQRNQKKLQKNYIYRNYSPEYRFARQIYQEKLADQVKIKIKQKILKGKDFNDDFLY